MESLSKFVARSITVMGSIGGSACALIANNPDASSLWQGLAAIGIGSAIAGGVSWFRADKQLKRDHKKRRDQRMITTAKRKHGRVTDVELVAETRFSLEDCRAFLQEMTESGSAEMHIGKEGTMVYIFPGFLSEDEKREARSTADWMPEVRAPRETKTASPPPLAEDEGSSAATTTTRSLEIE